MNMKFMTLHLLSDKLPEQNIMLWDDIIFIDLHVS